MLIIPPLPHDFGWYVPKNEKDAVFFLEGRLNELVDQANEFAWAVILCEQAELHIALLMRQLRSIPTPGKTTEDIVAALKTYDAQREPILQMMEPHSAAQRIAVRDSIMTVFHIGKILSSLQSLHGCPELARRCDLDQLSRHINVFKTSRFPNWESMRHAVGHLGELRQTRDAADKNTYSGTWSNSIVSLENSKRTTLRIVNGRELTLTWNNQILSYKLTADKLDKLVATVVSVREVFIAAALSFRPPK